MALKQQAVIVTKAFRHRSEDLGVGSVVVLDLPIAQELRSARKCEFAPDGAKPKVVPLAQKVRPPVVDTAALAAQVAALTEEVKQLKAGKSAPKEKASAQ